MFCKRVLFNAILSGIVGLLMNGEQFYVYGQHNTVKQSVRTDVEWIDIVREIGNKIKKPVQSNDSKALAKYLRNLLRDCVNIEALARSAFSKKYWKQCTQQHPNLIANFETFVVNFLMNMFSSYMGQTNIRFSVGKRVIKKGENREICMNIEADNKEYKLMFVISNDKIYDIIAEDISLKRTLQSQCKSVIQKGLQKNSSFIKNSFVPEFIEKYSAVQ